MVRLPRTACELAAGGGGVWAPSLAWQCRMRARGAPVRSRALATVVASPGLATGLPPKFEFYMRELPAATCTPFQSTEGKRLFAEALADGTMECYFPLAAQFRTRECLRQWGRVEPKRQ
jgi:hypothetical protein